MKQKILKEIKQNELMSNNLKNVYQNYIKHFLILASTVTGCILCFGYFFNQHSYRNYEFCNKIKNLRNKCRN